MHKSTFRFFASSSSRYDYFNGIKLFWNASKFTLRCIHDAEILRVHRCAICGRITRSNSRIPMCPSFIFNDDTNWRNSYFQYMTGVIYFTVGNVIEYFSTLDIIYSLIRHADSDQLDHSNPSINIIPTSICAAHHGRTNKQNDSKKNFQHNHNFFFITHWPGGVYFV